jgi:8-oxo-dGTP diphosphatase
MTEQKRPILCVDAITLVDNKVLMIKRKNDPFAGTYTLPGGYVDFGETTRDAIVREVKEETGLDVKVIATLGMYDDPKRDPRAHNVSMVYICAFLGGTEKPNPDESEEVKWVPIDDLGKYTIGFDHLKMIKSYLAIIMLGKSKFP